MSASELRSDTPHYPGDREWPPVFPARPTSARSALPFTSVWSARVTQKQNGFPASPDTRKHSQHIRRGWLWRLRKEGGTECRTVCLTSQSRKDLGATPWDFQRKSVYPKLDRTLLLHKDRRRLSPLNSPHLWPAPPLALGMCYHPELQIESLCPAGSNCPCDSPYLQNQILASCLSMHPRICVSQTDF